jgi:hypothetical protein
LPKKSIAQVVPEIYRFFGIVIVMYYNDHAPPHFHAKYGDFEMIVQIESRVVEGQFPRHAQSLVMEWYSLHQTELLCDWILAREPKPLRRIAPLE